MRMILLLVLLSVAKAADPSKPWKPGMCGERQKAPVSEAYIAYCIKATGLAPFCPVWTSADAASSAARAGGAYFELLDCSWHAGKNPWITEVVDRIGLGTIAPVAPLHVYGPDGDVLIWDTNGTLTVYVGRTFKPLLGPPIKITKIVVIP